MRHKESSSRQACMLRKAADLLTCALCIFLYSLACPHGTIHSQSNTAEITPLYSMYLYAQKLKEAVQFLNLHVSYISTYTSKIERPEFYLFAFRVRVGDGGRNKLHSAYKVPPASSK